MATSSASSYLAFAKTGSALSPHEWSVFGSIERLDIESAKVTSCDFEILVEFCEQNDDISTGREILSMACV